MPISIANLIPIPSPVTTGTPTTRRLSSLAGSDGPFQTVLADATAEARSAETRSALATDDADNAEFDVTRAQAESIDDEADDLLTSGLTGVLVAAGQLTPELVANQTVPPTRTSPLFRQFVAEASPQNNTRLATRVTQNPPPETTTTQTPLIVPQNTIPTAPESLATIAVIPGSVAAVQPAQRQVVVTQTPIVPGLIPNQMETRAVETPAPIAAPLALIAASGVPDARQGDRPGTAGEQFAAIASAASTFTIASQTTPAQAVFAPTATVATQPPLPLRTIPHDSPALKFASVLVQLTANVLAPVLTRPGEGVESKVLESDSTDVTRSGFGSPAPFSPNATSVSPKATAVQPVTVAVQIADEIITHTHIVERVGTTEFHIRLDPPELGAVRIRLVHSGDGINGQVVVSDDAIRRMIESQLPELRQRLEAAGVTLQRFDVSTDANTAGNSRDQYRSDGPTGSAPPSATGNGSAPRAPPGRLATSLLDVIA